MENPTSGIVLASGGGAATVTVAALPSTGVGAGAAISMMGHYLVMSALFAAAFVCIVLFTCAVMRARS